VLSDQEILALAGQFLPEMSWDSAKVETITKGGSDRSYWRLRAVERSVIFMFYTDRRPDNFSFAPATRLLAAHGVSVPRILAHDAEQRYLWSDDAGGKDLGDLKSSEWSQRRPLYEAALEEAAKIHRISPKALTEEDRGHLQPEFDAALYQWEQDYFFNHFTNVFLRVDQASVDRVRRHPELAAMVAELASLPRVLVHRDFQSQNVIVRENPAPDEPRVMLIDYQGLRAGRPEYDLASLLLDPYVDFAPDERTALIDYYRSIRGGDDTWAWDRSLYAKCAAQRLMQALGAYGYLGKVLGKTEFLRHIPVATSRLRGVLTSAAILPALSEILILES
jgi:aminoglycoside/choline kinase family phosphotransferase